MTEIPGCGGRGTLYLTLHCHHQNDSCIKTGSDESHLNVAVIMRDKDHNLLKKRRAEAESNRGPFAYQPNALPLGQAGSQ